MPSERAFVSSAIQGIIIAMAFAYIVLLIATRNIIQASLSLLCVIFIVVSVVAIMHMQGWQLGVSESISVVILIGFSVDYVIHLSADYMHSSFESRHDKMKQAFSEMGVSILSGTITTFGSGAFLFGGNIITF
jgi:protein dispatched 1